jgi:chromosomal replication initiator protein
MVRRALCKIIKVALTKELGKNVKFYKIKMENTYGNKQPFTELPSANRAPMKSQNIDAPYKI